MMYDKEADFPRLVGKALEAADKAAATNRQLPLSITLDPGTKREIKVQCKDEPRLPDVLKFAQSGKAYINGVLKEEGMVLRSPLDFRGQGPWPARPAASLPALKEARGGGVQITAENREYGEVSVDLRFAVATEDNQWWTCNVEQKFSQKSLQAAVALAEGNVKLWSVAAKGHYPYLEKPGGQPVRSVCAGVGTLAVTPREFSLTLDKRTSWSGFPDGIARRIHRKFPAEVVALFPFPSIVAAPLKRPKQEEARPAKLPRAPAVAQGGASSKAPKKQEKAPPPAPPPPSTLAASAASAGSAPSKPPKKQEAAAPAPAPAGAAAAAAPRGAPKVQRATQKSPKKSPKKWTAPNGRFVKKLWNEEYNKLERVKIQRATSELLNFKKRLRARREQKRKKKQAEREAGAS